MIESSEAAPTRTSEREAFSVGDSLEDPAFATSGCKRTWERSNDAGAAVVAAATTGAGDVAISSDLREEMLPPDWISVDSTQENYVRPWKLSVNTCADPLMAASFLIHANKEGRVL
ncbi:Hypothetical protein SMAX5B_008984 [Scophthalmus maximus]|uniref:Uncharacterized protein n=1 Tax=Scophthalmus maximus TaxID=52904 RepID=A0A2U9CJS8_SCOMX|nr:Hypothetical protein SMAX5B_008984 [Scophthalmus maximus]KAF0044208.1 hypothetical protein F2P81_003366 [Scophthalmus maximus]